MANKGFILWSLPTISPYPLSLTLCSFLYIAKLGKAVQIGWCPPCSISKIHFWPVFHLGKMDPHSCFSLHPLELGFCLGSPNSVAIRISWSNCLKWQLLSFTHDLISPRACILGSHVWQVHFSTGSSPQPSGEKTLPSLDSSVKKSFWFRA